MRLLITHLTRMKAPYVCMAGLNERNEHVRPVLFGQIERAMLDVPGGTVGLGSVVEFGQMRPIGQRPEVEDQLFDVADVKVLEVIDAKTLWSLQSQVAQPSLHHVFGPELERAGKSYAFPSGHGNASLGVLSPFAVMGMTTEFEKLRIRIDDGSGPVSLTVTDLRFCEDDHRTIKQDLVERANRAIGDGRQVLLSVGVSRAFDPKGEGVERHWLQVNNIYVEPPT